MYGHSNYIKLLNLDKEELLAGLRSFANAQFVDFSKMGSLNYCRKRKVCSLGK